MKLRESIVSELTYTDLKLVSLIEGEAVLQANRSDDNSRVIIIGQKVSNAASKKLLAAGNKNSFRIAQGGLLQERIQKAFLAPIFAERSSELYYLMPLKYFEATLQTTLQSFSFSERLEIAFKIAKGVMNLHNEVSIHHGNLHLSTIIIKKRQDDRLGHSVTLIPPFHAKIAKQALQTRKKLTVYRPPEVEFSKKSDIWSLGIIFYELFIGFELSIKNDMAQKPEQLGKFEFGLSIKDIKQSQEVQKMLKGMLNRNVEERISIQDVLCVLQKEVLRGLYGQEFSIPLIDEEKRQKRNNIRELRTAQTVQKGKVEEARVVLKQFVLVMRLIEKIRIAFSLHFRQDFQQFMRVEYYFSEFQLPIQNCFQNSSALYRQLAKKDKYSLRFEINGMLKFNQMAK